MAGKYQPSGLGENRKVFERKTVDGEGNKHRPDFGQYPEINSVYFAIEMMYDTWLTYPDVF